jgi:putative membrane-bound dehydrogenase-like protein
MNLTHRLCFLSIFLATACSTSTPPDEHSPEASLADLKVHEGFEVTLFASEPMFSNPTNMDIDAKGRVWICEAYNYRNQFNPKNPVREEGDRIMILEDTDGDGKADNSKVFYQGKDINAALGISVLGNRVIVSCSPNVFVFTDENGDDVADKKDILFQGVHGLQHDHAIHAFTFGHDGKLYFNMGNEGSVLLDVKGDTVVDIYGNKVHNTGNPYRQGLALRCDMDGSNVEVLGHNFRNNYELVVDPFGTVWQSDNDDDGNKGTRINYVMEHGNFGYTDEMTGAGWYARRTNMESEIPFRHWHLNDPGVVPNLLQTGAGSPTGMALYEGTMFPGQFRGQMIHAEPGKNVVRAYPVEDDGAGYKATIVNILEGQKDQWFRPADVTVAPDGSLFVADWYDPGVGGHQMGDVNRGRVYRVATKGTPYKVTTPDVNSPEGALKALFSPNVATRYLGYTALVAFADQSKIALESAWVKESPRGKAQLLWLLAKMPDGAKFIGEALKSDDVNLRIAGLRATRMMKGDVLAAATALVKDPSPQVRREVALALYGNGSNEAASLWATLALQHDGKDRWYLEALGIGASLNWDQYFAAWRKAVGKNWDTPAGHDIVWRSRASAAMPLLNELILKSNETEMLRYYRAFDFHKDASKQQVLATLIQKSKGKRVLMALKHMDPAKLKMTPAISTALNKALDEYKGSLEFVELVSLFKQKDRSPDLLAMSLQFPDSVKGKEAMKALVEWEQNDLILTALNKSNDDAQAIIKTVRPNISNKNARDLMITVMMDSTRNIELRKLAVKTFGGPWEAEDQLLALARDKKLPADLHTAAAGVFQTAWRSSIRDEAAKYITLPGSKGATSLPPISKLAEKSGDASKGKEVFKNVCSTCHQVKKEGVNFGPDLSEIGAKLSKEGLYTAILFPDQGISFGYEAWRIKLKDGSTAFGRIVSETEDKIDMQYMQQQQTVQKPEIESRTKLENSLMPSNLQSSMTEEELVDLVEYLGGLR